MSIGGQKSCPGWGKITQGGVIFAPASRAQAQIILLPLAIILVLRPWVWHSHFFSYDTTWGWGAKMGWGKVRR